MEPPLGHLSHDGFEWRWRALGRGGSPRLIRETMPGKLPPFIESLLPEGWLAQVLHQSDEREVLRSGKRYMSNIAIVRSRDELAKIPQDVLQGELAAFSKSGRFMGSYRGPGRGRDRADLRAESGAALYPCPDPAPVRCPDQGADVPDRGWRFGAGDRAAVHAYLQTGWYRRV
jgi:hypothetical protein